MAREFGNKAQVYVEVAPTAVTVGASTKVADVRDSSFPFTPVKADRSSNDTGTRAAHGVVRWEGDLTFKVAALDPADPGHAKIISVVGGVGMLNVVYRPYGTGSGLPSYAFEASVDLKQSEPYDGWIMADVTLSPSGPVTRTLQT
jgi:hypothetical protein